MIKVFIADDHTLMREGLRRGLAVEKDMTVVGEARTGKEALVAIESSLPDVVLLDVSMPIMDGIETTQRLRASHPSLPIVVLTMHGDPKTLSSAVKAGASGYLLKDAHMEDVVSALRKAVKGDSSLTPQLAAPMMTEFRRLATGDSGETEDTLTKQEEVLQSIADGHSTQEVADQLFISTKTVKNHLASIYEKLEANDRTQAVVIGLRSGIIQINQPVDSFTGNSEQT